MALSNREPPSPPYQIIESEGFARQFAALVPAARLRDDLLRAFFVELPTDPDKFEQIPGTRLRRAIVNCTPPLRLFFTVRDRIITLLEIHPL